MSTYKQPVKEVVRRRLLTSAVTALTSDRDQSPIIRLRELQEVAEHALRLLRPPLVSSDFAESLRQELSRWSKFDKVRVGRKGPDQLHVLYLCGPEPLNDLEILTSLGVDPHNVWAITSSEEDLEKAVTEISRSFIPLKIHHGSLAEFFDVVPESFDIVYVDACGPFAAGKPNTLLPLLSVFVQQRLCPLAALITTFSEAPTASDSATKYVDVMTSYFRYRYRDLPREAHAAGLEPELIQHEPEDLKGFIKQHIGLMYSEFITKLLSELAGYLIPSCRALSMKSLFSSYVAQQADNVFVAATDPASEAKSIEEFAQTAGDMILSPSTYPLLSFLEQIKRVEGGTALANQLGNLKINGKDVGTLLKYLSLLDHVFEGHWDSLSGKLKRALALSWFDKESHFSCDAPLPNLLINSLLGIYGRPWYVNPTKSVRLSYVAKTNRMYCDCLLLDQCRSFFDWWPTIDLCPSRFESLEFQVLARCIIDRISWHSWQTDNHPFRGGAVAGMSEVGCAKPYDFGPREEVMATSEG